VISGLLTARADHVVDALAPLRAVERRTKEGWTAITLRH
jgi:ribosomal protein L11 methylase PrmA